MPPFPIFPPWNCTQESVISAHHRYITVEGTLEQRALTFTDLGVMQGEVWRKTEWEKSWVVSPEWGSVFNIFLTLSNGRPRRQALKRISVQG